MWCGSVVRRNAQRASRGKGKDKGKENAGWARVGGRVELFGLTNLFDAIEEAVQLGLLICWRNDVVLLLLMVGCSLPSNTRLIVSTVLYSTQIGAGLLNKAFSRWLEVVDQHGWKGLVINRRATSLARTWPGDTEKAEAERERENKARMTRVVVMLKQVQREVQVLMQLSCVGPPKQQCKCLVSRLLIDQRCRNWGEMEGGKI